MYMHLELEDWLGNVFYEFFYLQFRLFMYLLSNEIWKQILKDYNCIAEVDVL